MAGAKARVKKIVKSEAEWQKQLTAAEFAVARAQRYGASLHRGAMRRITSRGCIAVSAAGMRYSAQLRSSSLGRVGRVSGPRRQKIIFPSEGIIICCFHEWRFFAPSATRTLATYLPMDLVLRDYVTVSTRLHCVLCQL